MTPKAYLTGQGLGPRPESIGVKFSPEGRPLRNAGCTFVCHVDPESDVFAALVDVQDRLKAEPFSGAFTYLPPASFHMTVFEGVIDNRRDRAEWPEGLALDAPVMAATAVIGRRQAEVPACPAFRVRATGVFGGFSVSLTGADAAAEAALRAERDALSAALKRRSAGHDAYDFHITLGYLRHWLTGDQADAVIAASEAHFAAVAPKLSNISLGPREFCAFETMHHFQPIS